MDIEMLKELKAEFEKVRKYNDMHCMSTVTEDDVLELIDEAIARQSTTSLIPHNINYYKCKKCEQLIHKYIHKPKYCPSCGKPVKED